MLPVPLALRSPFLPHCRRPFRLTPPPLQELVPSELEEFCSDSGVRLGFVPAHAKLDPAHLHSSDDATFSPFSSAPEDPLRDGGMEEGAADAMRAQLNRLLVEGGGEEGEDGGTGSGEKGEDKA